MDYVEVALNEKYRTVITARDHTWHADVKEDSGGDDSAPTPEEMLLGALGSCMAETMKLYAARKGWVVEHIGVQLELERFNASDYPAYEGDSKFIHEIREHIVIEGPLDDEQRVRLLEIAGRCPVRRVLASPTFFVELAPESPDVVK